MKPSAHLRGLPISLGRRWAVACPGQGANSSLLAPFSAYAGEIHPTLDAVEKVLGPEFAAQLLNPTDSFLQETANAQPAIVASSYAIADILHSRYGVSLTKSPEIAFFLGHLLGEYTAHLLAGTYSLEDALSVVRRRGELMQEKADDAGNDYGMSAVLFRKPAFDAVKETASRYGVLANINSNSQIVFSGKTSHISHAIDDLKRLQKVLVRLRKLPVTVPFHSKLLRPIEIQLLELLVPFSAAVQRKPVVANLTGVPGSLAETVKATSRPVQWASSVDYLVENHVTDVVNLGPGTVLEALSAQSKLRQHTLSSPEALAEFAETFGA